MKYIKDLVQGQRNEIEAIFKAIDTDNNGYLSRDEFVQAFSEMKLNTKYLGLVYKKMDKNNDQKVSYVEFLSSMLESNNKDKGNLLNEITLVTGIKDRIRQEMRIMYKDKSEFEEMIFKEIGKK